MGEQTIGGPVALRIENRDARSDEPPLTRPRPGHADLVGTMKYGFEDARRALERASARETAARVAVGAVCRRLLDEFAMMVFSHVTEIGGGARRGRAGPWENLPPLAEASEPRGVDPPARPPMPGAVLGGPPRGDTPGGPFPRGGPG